jgi:hypothetical protein
MNLCYLRCSWFRRLLCIVGCEEASAICAMVDRWLMRGGR